MYLLLKQFSIATAGFSIIALILLIVQKRTESNIAKILANILLSALLMIQFLQAFYITGYLLFDGVIAILYLLLLGLVGPIFYLYSQHIIQADKKWTRHEIWHFLPIFTIT